jgi:serine/threonine protein kinase
MVLFQCCADTFQANVLVHNSGRAVLADFGLSAVTDPQILKWTSQSSAASKGGTIRWQAPELFGTDTDELVHNSKPSDIYALACILYEVSITQFILVVLCAQQILDFHRQCALRRTPPRLHCDA